MSNDFIIPDWPAPDCIQSLQTTRYLNYETKGDKEKIISGASQKPWDSFNLALHVQDQTKHVNHNRELLNQYLPSPPFWLNQIHSKTVVEVSPLIEKPVDADGSFSLKKNQVCSIMTADCLPILFCMQDASIIAAIHAGWKGLSVNIIDNTVKLLCKKTNQPAKNLLVWLGPAISQKHFEVGIDVKQKFELIHTKNKQCFIPSISEKGKYFANIYDLARINLRHLGVNNIYGGEYCTYEDKEHFFSYRRGGITGRMASLIWRV